MCYAYDLKLNKWEINVINCVVWFITFECTLVCIVYCVCCVVPNVFVYVVRRLMSLCMLCGT